MNNNNDNYPSFKQNLIRARSHIIFILALITAFSLVIFLNNSSFENRVVSKSTVKKIIDLKTPDKRKLTSQEMEWAKIAWKYFQILIDSPSNPQLAVWIKWDAFI